ncbi:MAG TPA: DUF5683 domain-containing protein [Ignavibacteria bacterium]|nr:DUF5683 domain-containing protein [Ignavibacteria bacterium]
MMLKIFILSISLFIAFLSSAPEIFPQENFFELKPRKEFNSKLNTKQHLLYNSQTQDSFADTNDVKQTTFVMKKSPLTATLLSAAIPGAGQFYNESYWKIPVIAGVGGYLVYEIIQSNKDYRNYADQYSASITTQNPSGDARLLSLREFYRDERDRFFIYTALLYLVQIADAYVDAELYDFDVSDKMKFTLGGNNILGMKINF